MSRRDQTQHHGWLVHESNFNSSLFAQVQSLILCVLSCLLSVWLPISKPFDVTTVFLGKVLDLDFVTKYIHSKFPFLFYLLRSMDIYDVPSDVTATPKHFCI